jgi:hypothetical protein
MTSIDENRAFVVAVSRDSDHRFSKQPVDEIVLIAGWGVEGDAHAGTTVQHLSRVARDPSQPNLRQVHLIHTELFEEVAAAGYEVEPGSWARTSPQGASTCSPYLKARCCIWVTTPWCASPVFEIHASKLMDSNQDCSARSWGERRMGQSNARAG